MRWWKFGDFDLDLDVDLTDLGTLASNYGAGQAEAYAVFQSMTGVPEPTTAGVGGAMFLMLLSRRFSSRFLPAFHEERTRLSNAAVQFAQGPRSSWVTGVLRLTRS